MIDEKSYVPILKGKEAEYISLKELSEKHKARITSFIEVPSIPWDFINDMPAKTIDKHLEKIPTKLEDCWGPERRCFIDLGMIPDEERIGDGRHPVSYILDGCREKGLQVIPVTGIGRDSRHQDAVRGAVAQDRRGICLRIINDDIEEFGDGLEEEIDGLATDLDVSLNDTDLLIDLGEILPSQEGPIGVALRGILRTLPRAPEYRSLILAATAFPRDLGKFPSATISTTPRSEWTVWRRLAESPRSIPRLPTFGDYAIAHPEPVEIDPRIMQMAANLRYTGETEWIIVKGRTVKRYGFDQSHDLCRQLIGHHEYRGEDFSWGDAWIQRCANEEEGPGNATTWRKVGTTHHLTLVVEQIASFHGS